MTGSRMSFLSEAKVPTIRQAAMSGGSIGAVGQIYVTDSMTQEHAGEDRTAREQKAYYRYWTYVALSRIGKYCAQFFPNLSFQRNASRTNVRPKQSLGQHPLHETRGRHYTSQSLRWLSRHYQRQLRRVSSHQLKNRQSNIDLDLLEPIPEDNPLISLLCYPNSYNTYGSFVQEWILNRRLTGRAYIWVIRNVITSEYSPRGVPAEVHVIPTEWVTEVYDQDSGKLIKYIIVPEGDSRRRKDVRPEDMVKSVNTHPTDKLGGMSEVRAGARWLENAESIEKSRSSSFKGPNPDVIVSIDPEKFRGTENGRQLTHEELIFRVKERFRQRSYRGPDHHGEPLVQPPGVEISPWSLNPREMDYGISAEAMRDNILALYGVHHIIAGISQDYTRATSEAAWAVFCEVTANPELKDIADALQEIADMFDPRIIVWFDDCTPDSPELQLQKMQEGLKSGPISLDEWRQYCGYEPRGTPEYETGYMGAGQVPVDQEFAETLVGSEDDLSEPAAADDEADTQDDETDDTTEDDTEQD